MGRIVDAWKALTNSKQTPPFPLPPKSGRRSGSGRRTYEGARLGPADGWFAGASDPNSEISSSLLNLRQSSRKLYRDNPYARRIIDGLTNAIVSTGIRPTIDTGDEDLDATVYSLWEGWGRAPVSGSKLTIYGLQQLMVRAWLVDGEAILRLRPRFARDMPGLPPLKLQPLEADFLPVEKSESVGSGLNKIYSAVEYDALGEVAAFHLLKDHPGAMWPFGLSSTYDTTRVPADSIIHLFHPERPNQVRGVPVLAPVILSLYDLAGYTEAIRVGTRAAATLVATVSGGDQSEPPDGLANETDESGSLVTDSNGTPIEGLAPGTVIYAPDGKTITVSTPQPPSGVADFIASALHEIAAGAGLSYHVLSGDMSDSSFAQAKLGLIEQAKNVTVRREGTLIPVALNPIWRAFVDASIAAGLLPNNPALYNVRWSQPRQQSADDLQDAKANLLRMQTGDLTLTEIIESTGRDPDEVFAQAAKDKILRDKYGIVSLGDLSQVSTSGVVQQILTEKPAP